MKLPFGETGAAVSTVLDSARAYARAGLSVIPVSLDGTKAPALAGWREYASRRPTPAELDAWFGADPPKHGIGIPGGPASGNLAVLDFETDAAFRTWGARLTPDERGLLGLQPVARTPGGGWHVYLRLTEPVRGMKLARTAAGRCLVEVRGEGHQVVAPGSPPACHPTGRVYRWVRGGWLDGPPTPPVLSDVFHGLTVHAAELNEYVKPAAREVVGDRPGAAAGDRPGDCFNVRIGWGDVLAPHGWTVFRSTDRTTYWTRPGKAGGVSASTGFCTGPSGGSLLYVFSTSAAPFEAERSYSKFAAYAVLNHAGDFAAATRALGLAGYGRPAARTPRVVVGKGVRP